MKKILSFLLLGLMCSIGNLWAAAPDYESYDWASEAEAEAVAGNHDGIVISYAGLNAPGNVSGHWYIPNNQNLKNSDSEWKYFGVSSNKQIDSIAVFYCPNGSNLTSIAWVAWGKNVTPNQYTLDHGVTTGTTSSKSWENAVWETIDLTGVEAYTVYLSRSIREFREIGGTSNLPNFGGSQTFNVLGIRVWLKPVTHTVTYVANGSGEENVIDDQAIEVAANPFTWAGHAFTGWNTADDGSGTPYAVGAKLSGDITLYAQWAAAYTVTYNPNGATGEPFVDNTAAVIAANMFTVPDGKRFTGWNTAADGTGTNYAVDAAVTSNLTLYAQWASVYGEIIKATLINGTSATVTGVIGGTADVSLSSSKKMDKGKYFGIQLANGTFHEGDTVNINITASSGGKVCLFEDKDRTNCLYLGSDKGVVGDNKIVLPAGANGITTLYVARDADDATYSWNPNLNFISVIRPVAVVSEAWESLTIDNGPTSYNRTGTVINVVDAYLNPTVVVTKHVVYADATEANVDVEVEDLEVVGNQYVGHVTIGGDVYTINIAKLASYDVTYMYGEEEIGTEVVAANGHPAEYATAQNAVKLATFDGWYRDAGLSNQVANIAAEIISANVTYYAKYTKRYATSINIEQYALDNGKSGTSTNALIAQMGAQYFASNFAYVEGTNEIDVLNDEKGDRNYSYLGLKVKTAGTMFDFRLAQGNTVKVKFGARAGAAPQVSINGAAYANMTITDNVYTHTATSDEYISIKTADAKAVVFKQIAIGEDLENIILPSSDTKVTLSMNGWASYVRGGSSAYSVSDATVYKAAYNGSDAVVLTEVVDAVVPANQGIILKGEEGATVTITPSDETASDFSGNGLVGVVAPLAATEGTYVLSTNAGVTAFNPCQAGVMIPAHKAYISIPSNAPAIRIIFAENGATGINELEGAEKAVKFIKNGKLYIQKDGVVYDATGAKVK